MATRIPNELADRGNKCVQLVALMAMTWAAASTLLACSSDSTKDEDASQDVAPGSTGGTIGPQGGAGGSFPTQTGGATGGTTAAGSGGAAQPGTGDAGGTAPGMDASTDDGGSQITTTAGSSGQAAGGGGQSGSTADAGPNAEAGPIEEDSGLVADCTPSDWVDPGTVPNPEVVKMDPTAGQLGHPWGWTEAVDDFDYIEEEFFFTGTTPAPYTSRMLVRRPRDPARFTGTVFVEWYNVSGGIDFDPLWAYSWDYIMREGHVEVSVSAQLVGANALKTNDSERYTAINHPGDTAADAIFSQAAMAIRSQTELILGPCMPVDAVLGMGQSQSSMRLSAYINNTAPTDKIYDGYITHTGMEPASNDPGVPTFVVLSMTEGNGTLTDGPTLVKWVVAGATHTDHHTVTRGARAASDLGMDTSAINQCQFPMNTYPSWRAYNAVCDWLHRWVRYGERPPSGTPLQTTGGFFGGYETDEHGNVLGGVRLPEIDVPIATYSTENAAAPGSDFISGMACGLGGATEAFTEDKLLQLYPTHDDYVQKYTAASEKAVADGFLLEEDSQAAIEEAQNAPIPN